MSHELEVHENGNVSFASLRVPGWHRLGTVFDEPVKTQEMLELALLNKWNLRLEKVLLPHDCYRDYYSVVRDNWQYLNDGVPVTEILGLVGERYNVLQNEELFDFGDNLLDGGGVWETAGSLKHGTVVFATLSIPNRVTIDPQGVADEVNSYLLLNTSHDGSLSIQASVTPVRVVCANTLNMALRGVKQTYKIRHTQTMKGRVLAARKALDLGADFMTKFEKEATALYQTPVSADLWDKILNKVFPEPEGDSKIAATKYQNKVDGVRAIYTGETNGTIAGTAWGAFNALTERLDWHRTGRGDNAEENIAAAASGFDPVTNAEKSRLLKIVKTMAEVKV